MTGKVSCFRVVNPVFLLDSNICIYLLEGLSPIARRRVETFEPGELVTSAVVYAEVMMGIDRSKPLVVEAVDRFFDFIDVLPFDALAGRCYASLPFKRRSYDRLIAAHALALELPLVTSNERDFSDIPGLRVENWTRA